MAEQASQEKNELDVVFSEEEYHGYKIKPWTLKQLIKIWPLLSRVMSKLKEKGIEFSGLEDLFTSNAPLLIECALSDIPEFLSVSLNISIEIVEEFDLSEVTIIMIKVIAKNITHLKNSLAQVIGEMAGIVRAVNSTSIPSSE